MEDAFRRAYRCPESSKIPQSGCTSSLRLPKLGEVEVVLSLQKSTYQIQKLVGVA